MKLKDTFFYFTVSYSISAWILKSYLDLGLRVGYLGVGGSVDYNLEVVFKYRNHLGSYYFEKNTKNS